MIIRDFHEDEKKERKKERKKRHLSNKRDQI